MPPNLRNKANNLSESFERGYTIKVRKALGKLPNFVKENEIIDLLRKSRDLKVAEDIFNKGVDWENYPSAMDEVDKQYRTGLKRSANTETGKVPGVKNGSRLVVDESNSELLGISQVMRHERITNLSEQAKKTIKTIVANGLSERRKNKEIAERIRNHININSRQEQHLWNLKARLKDRNKSDSYIDAAIKKKKEKQLDYRSEMIANTETTRLESEGKTFMWDNMDKEGVINKNKYQKMWNSVLDEKTSATCMQLDGVYLAPYNTRNFTDPTGNFVSVPYPPIHVNCRSRILLVRRR